MEKKTQIIITTPGGEDSSFVPDGASLDLEIGDGYKNDFELKMPVSEFLTAGIEPGGMIYIDGTEYGGIMQDITSDTKAGSVSVGGDSWRGLLDIPIIEPPSGASYLTVTGDLHAVMRQLLGDKLGSLYEVNSAPCGVTVSNWRVDRYVTVLSAVTKCLASVGYRLNIAADGSGNTLRVILSAVPATDYSEDIEVSQDSRVYFKISRVTRRYTHIIAAGAGKLENRTIIKLRQNADGAIERVTTIPEGLDIRPYFYDYSAVESDDELEKAAREKFAEINATDSQEVSLATGDDTLGIGDIVGGRDYVTGLYVSNAITKKVVRVDGGRLSVDYSIGG